MGKKSTIKETDTEVSTTTEQAEQKEEKTGFLSNNSEIKKYIDMFTSIKGKKSTMLGDLLKLAVLSLRTTVVGCIVLSVSRAIINVVLSLMEVGIGMVSENIHQIERISFGGAVALLIVLFIISCVMIAIYIAACTEDDAEMFFYDEDTTEKDR